MAIGNVKVISHKNEVIQAKNDAIARALEAIGIQAEGDVVSVITAKGIVDTGRLRDSITYATSRHKDKPRGVAKAEDAVQGSPEEDSVYVGTNVEYAAYHEYGTSRMKARPYLKPAIMGNLDTYKKIAEKYLSS